VRTTTRSPQPRGLAEDLHRTFRTLLLGLTLVTVVLGALSFLLLGVVQPQVRADTDLLRTIRLDHEAMLDVEAGMQGWLATGDPSHLDLAEAALARIDASSARLLDMLGHRSELSRPIVERQLAAQAWIDGWALPAAALNPRSFTSFRIARVFDEGQVTFVDYRDAHTTAVELASTMRDGALDRLQSSIVAGFATTVTIVALVGFQLTRQRRRLDRQLAAPVEALVAGMEAIKRGEPTELHELEGPHELKVLAYHLQETSGQVRSQLMELEVQRADSEAAAATLSSILSVAREIAGSLSVRYVAATVAGAAADIVPCERAVIWLTEDGTDFIAVHDTSLDHGAVPLTAPVVIGIGAVGAVASDAKPQVLEGSACFPLVVGGRVMGVLELVGSAELDRTSNGSLETLATHAAAALEAARLHRTTEELAQVDPLTRLLNRRRLDADLAVELDRSNRYGRPLGFIMLDLDRFKLLNDTFGHQHGDEVLRLTAECLTTTLRTSDTVYRYGGEEFAVLIREGTRTACVEAAERLRLELAATFAGRDGFSAVTASFGVALSPEHGETAAELILAADAALYTAKAEGRDRVVLAPLDGRSSTHGPGPR
jgi:diguanylate cyclase (GGDEF)-like protein